MDTRQTNKKFYFRDLVAEYDPENPSKESYKELEKEFIQKMGDIQEIFICKSKPANDALPAGVVLIDRKVGSNTILGKRWRKLIGKTTQPDLLFDHCNLKNPELQAHISRVQELKLESSKFLTDKDLRDCLGFLFTAARNILCLVECPYNEKGQDDKRNHHLEVIKQQINKADEYHTEYAKLRAQKFYMQGVIMGLLVLVILILAYSYFIHDDLSKDYQSLWVAVLAGVLGAATSVFSRISKGILECQYQLQKRIIRIQGVTRPFVGAIAGTLVYFMVSLNLFGPTDLSQPNSIKTTASLFLLGFASGFSERWIEDHLLMFNKKLKVTNSGDSE